MKFKPFRFESLLPNKVPMHSVNSGTNMQSTSTSCKYWITRLFIPIGNRFVLRVKRIFVAFNCKIDQFSSIFYAGFQWRIYNIDIVQLYESVSFIILFKTKFDAFWTYEQKLENILQKGQRMSLWPFIESSTGVMNSKWEWRMSLMTDGLHLAHQFCKEMTQTAFFSLYTRKGATTTQQK